MADRPCLWRFKILKLILTGFLAAIASMAFGRHLRVGCEYWVHLSVETQDVCLVRAKTSALLRRKTCAVLGAGACASFRANTKVAAFGRHHKWGRPLAVPLCGFLRGGFERRTCPSSNTAHVLRLNKADGLALNKAHVVRLNTAAEGRLHKGGVGLENR